jgi:ectoine hydroxylase-related dioxygenase (phytanoyl-CoA dioxygenase family)
MFADLDLPYPLSAAQRAQFQRDGFIHLTQVLTPETLGHFGPCITRGVMDWNAQTKPMASRTTYERAFLQVMNLWRHDPEIQRFVFSRRLARIAAELMESRGVRLYHDQALYKEPGGGITPFHADQYDWPLATDRTCTAWIPLQDTPLEMGPLEFVPGSHRIDLGRAMPISDDSERQFERLQHGEGLAMVREPFRLGDVSFHSGWTFHHASPNHTDRSRSVMTIIYMDIDARVAEPIRQEQVNDWQSWLPGVAIGEVAASPLNPVLYEETRP